jgi:hypothetical protein
MSLWKTRQERYPDLYCACGYRMNDLLWIPGERSRHTARHRAYSCGKKLSESFPRERIGPDNIVVVPGEETGVVSRTVYYLARDFHRQCGFDVVPWSYMGERPLGDPGCVAYLYVRDGFGVGIVIGDRTSRLVRVVYTAANYRRQGVASKLAARFAGDLEMAVSDLAWDGPFTSGGAALMRRLSQA